MNLTEWAKARGVHRQTAYRWFREGALPVPAQRVGPRTILVNIETRTASVVEVLTLFCARLYGRRSARNRARKALEAAEHG